MLLLLLEGKVEGTNWVGRHRILYIKQIDVQDVWCKSYAEMKELALRRKEWRAASNQL